MGFLSAAEQRGGGRPERRGGEGGGQSEGEGRGEARAEGRGEARAEGRGGGRPERRGGEGGGHGYQAPSELHTLQFRGVEHAVLKGHTTWSHGHTTRADGPHYVVT